MNERMCSIVMAFIILMLSFVDAINTIFILSHGGEEINPLMEKFIKEDLTTFILVKQGMTMFFIGFLVWFKRYKVLAVLTTVYIMLLAYQVMLIWGI